MANKKPQITPEVDTRPAVEGFAKIGDAAEKMGEKVKRSGEEGGKGNDKITDGAEKSARAYGRFEAQIVRSSAQIKASIEGTGRAGEIANIAIARGLDPAKLEPSLSKLRELQAAQLALNNGLGNLGNTAKQTTAALRQVPAQFTDIVVSLQGGQNPMTVLLQQGGQLKDVFGGAGIAARALGGYVLSLINPFTLAAGALAAIGYGFFKGAEEAQAFNKALVLSGNSAGTTVGQLTAMAERLDALGTTQAKASEGLTEFVNAGVKGAAGLERYTLAAINLEKAGGPAVKETAKAFADLGKDPLQAALKLDEATNFLTKSTYEQIKSLTEQGRATDAAKVAQDAYADAINQRAPEILERLGAVERAWLAIKKGAAEAADNAIFSIGRPESLQQQLAAAQLRKRAAQFDFEQANSNGGGGLIGRFQASRALAREREADADIQSLNRSLLKEAEVTAQLRAQNEQKQNLFAADKILSELADKKAKQAAEELRVRTILVAAGKSEEEVAKALAAVREKYAAKTKPDNSAAKALEEEAKLLEKLAGLSGTYYSDLQDRFKLFDSGKLSLDEYQKSIAKLTAEQPFSKEAEAAAKEQAKLAKELSEEWLKGADIYAKWVAELNKGAESVEKQVQSLQDEAIASELAAAKNISLAQAIEEVAIARLREKRDGSASDQEISALDREIAARQKLLGEIGKKEERKATEDALKELDKFLDPKKADDFGNALTKAFEGAGNSLAKMVNLLENADFNGRGNRDAQAAIDKMAEGEKKIAAQRALNNKQQRESISLYAGLAGTAKGFFNEGTKGYKALEIAETAFRAYQLASDFQKGASAAAVGVANQAQGEPYSAFARMAAMAAAMASLGFQVANFSGSGGATGGDGAKQATGKGTVFGDAEAQSESIANSIDLLSDTAKLQLTTQSGMLSALRNIENSIGGVTNQVLRSGLTDGNPSERFGIATTGKKIFGTKVSITGTGLASFAQTLGDVFSNGLNLKEFADVTKKSKFLGITTGSSSYTNYQAADPALQRQFGQIFKDFASTLTLAAGPLDLALDDVNSRINGFVVDIGKIDFTGLKGDEIAEKLGAVIGAEGDKIAAAAIPGLESFQRVGEGYFETVVRVASGVETAGAALELLGIGAIKFGDIALKQGDVAAEIVRQSIAAFESLDGSLSSVGAIVSTLDGSADDLADTYRALLDVRDSLLSVGESGDALTATMIRGAGGIDSLQSSLNSYFDNFFDDQERTSAQLARLSEDFARIGVQTIPTTREQFRALVESIDTSTDAGQKFFAQVIGLADAFASAVPATKALEDAVKTLDYVMTTSGRFDAKAFTAEVSKITAEDIQKNILEQSPENRDRAQLNFDVGSATFLGAYANSLAAARLAPQALSNPVPVYGGSGGGSGGGSDSRADDPAIDALKSLTDAIKSLDQQLGDFINELTLGAESFLSPEQRFFESQNAFKGVLAQAKAGDQAAAEQVTARARDFVEANRSYFGSSQKGTDNIRKMVEELQALRAQNAKLLDTAEHANRINSQGFSEVAGATEESAEITGQALLRARLSAQSRVGFES